MDKILMVLFFMVIAVLISAGFVMLGWWLFAVPVFNMPSLTILQAIGLSILLNAKTTLNYKAS